MMNVKIHSEGEVEELTPDEADDAKLKAPLVRKMARLDAYTEDELAKAVKHNENVVRRAFEEDDVHVANFSVAYWLEKEDDEVGEMMENRSRVTGLVEDYSEDAWRVIATEVDAFGGDFWFSYEWTFMPKSASTVMWVESDNEELEDYYGETEEVLVKALG